MWSVLRFGLNVEVARLFLKWNFVSSPVELVGRMLVRMAPFQKPRAEVNIVARPLIHPFALVSDSLNNSNSHAVRAL